MFKKKFIIPVVALMLVANTGAVFAGDFAGDADDLDDKDRHTIKSTSSYSKPASYSYLPYLLDQEALTPEEIEHIHDTENR
ncbi:hypothetical protein R9X47_09725 [Wukongibacter baidiensis]|uniref:hypothetical protein n=1 Tax=Wukongibacter baidiensis TaxID=1723361 RepID=UPI003D7FFA26